MTSAEHLDIQYLKSDGVGKVISQALAELYREKPQFPIDYLTKWLYNYSAQQEERQKIHLKLNDRKKLIEDLERQNKAEIEKDNEKRLKAESSLRSIQAFEDHLEKQEYPDELVSSFFPDGIFNLIHDLTAVYVAFYENVRKPVDLNENDDELAHLATDQAKLIQYVGGDSRVKPNTAKWVLPEGKGVTYKLFTEPEAAADKGDPNPDEENEKEPESKYIYVPDVVVDPNIYYFDIPRLGAYLAVPIFIKSYLNEASFDDAIVKLNDYKKQSAEAEKKKAEIQADFEEKIAKAKEVDEDIEELVKEYKEYPFPNVDFPSFVNEQKKYALCVDTLGKDHEISQDDIKKIDLLCQSFAKKWMATELRYLQEDVERWINYENTVNSEEILTQYITTEEQQVPLKLQGMGELSEAETQFKSDEIRLQVVKEQLLNKDVALHHLMGLAEYRTIKYPRVLQNAFYLAGYTKEVINEPGTNVLNWRKVRKEIFNHTFIDRLMAYVYSGPKDLAVPKYASINRISKRISDISKHLSPNIRR